MARSIHSFSCRKWPTAARSVVATSCTASAGRPASVRAVRQDAMQGGVGMQRLAAAAQDDGVAALDAQAGRVHRHVGPRFVDEKDHAERDADLVDLQTVGPNGAGADLSHRIGQRRHVAQAGGGVAQPGRGQPQPIHLRRASGPPRRRRPRPFRWRRGFRRPALPGRRRRREARRPCGRRGRRPGCARRRGRGGRRRVQ